MKKKNDQLDFNFSRPIDFQRNLSLNFINEILLIINNEYKKNLTYSKHLKFLVLELFFCWTESDEQMLTVSMSKRGYLSESRYNPNKISSYLIKIIKFLKSSDFIEFYPGFYDSVTMKSRLTRIKASAKLVDLFKKLKVSEKIKLNHPKREFVIKMDGNKRVQYSDDFETQDVKEIMFNYNEIITKTIFDIPMFEKPYITRFDNKKILISTSGSQANFIFSGDIKNNFKIDGCWWNKIDYDFLKFYAKHIIVNDKPTSFFSLNENFNDFLKKKIGIENFFKKKDLESFSSSQICNLIVKGINSKSFKSFFRSILLEKKKFFDSTNVSTQQIKRRMEIFIEDNQPLSSYFFKEYKLHWEEFLNEVFYKLLQKCVPSNIPVFMIKDKIYFSTDFSSLIKENLEKILENVLGLKKVKLSYVECLSYNFKSRGFFSNILKSDTPLSKRYEQRIKQFK